MSRSMEYRAEVRVPPAQMAGGRVDLRETPLPDILRLSLERVARDHGGRVVDSYRDNSGRRHPAFLALETQECPLGVGFTPGRSGRLEFHYDAAATPRQQAEALAREVSQNYAVIALLRALQRRGCTVSGEDRPLPSGEKVVHVPGIKEGSCRIEATVDPRASSGWTTSAPT